MFVFYYSGFRANKREIRLFRKSDFNSQNKKRVTKSLVLIYQRFWHRSIGGITFVVGAFAGKFIY